MFSQSITNKSIHQSITSDADLVNFQCITVDLVCNGRTDCPKEDDEIQCGKCSINQSLSPTNQSINRFRLMPNVVNFQCTICNGRTDCPKEDDEIQCGKCFHQSITNQSINQSRINQSITNKSIHQSISTGAKFCELSVYGLTAQKRMTKYIVTINQSINQ